MSTSTKMNYVEFPASDIGALKVFYGDVFGWTFVDYGEDYCAFNDGVMDGGFYTAPLSSSTENGAALIVLYSDELESLQSQIESSGGSIVKPIFEFPGGRRFHFTDPCGNELAIWCQS
ncbi:MAG: VOC family protein [Pseudomonadota bacterium]